MCDMLLLTYNSNNKCYLLFLNISLGEKILGEVGVGAAAVSSHTTV